MRRIVIGDVHGCYDELIHLLAMVSYGAEDDVILDGDLVDRGPKPVEVVRYAREKGFRVVEGNHEEKLIRYERHERRRRADPAYKNPMRAFNGERAAQHASFTAEEHDWFAALPAFLRFEHEGRQWIISHAGIASNEPIETQDKKLLVRCRTVHADTGAYLSGDDPNKPPAGAVYWATRYSGTESVVYGHIVHKDFAVRRDVTPNGALLLGIDTGCCFGGALTAAVFQPGIVEPEIFTVPARGAYAARQYGDYE